MTDADVEAVARRMCVELDLDPDAIVNLRAFEDLTPKNWYGPTFFQPPLIGAPPYQTESYYGNGARWRSFRRDAAIHIAAWKATNYVMMTGNPTK